MVIFVVVAIVIAVVVGLAVGIAVSSVLRAQAAPPATGPSPAEVVELVLSLTDDKLAAQAAAADQQLGHRTARVDEQVAAMTAELSRVGELVTGLQRDRAREHGELTTRLDETARHSRALAETTQSLRQVLASPKARGQWGERMADDVLRSAGLIEGVNYRRQKGLAGGGIPDVTFLLPGDRVLHMDVKFPIDNYVRASRRPARSRSRRPPRRS